MFQLSHVSKTYGGQDALHDVTLEIGGGMSYIVGPSGSGKTTLLKIMSGMDDRYEGTVSYNGQDLRTLAKRDRSRLFGQVFGFVWQDFNLIEERTVRENVELASWISAEADERAIVRAMRDMKIEKLAERPVRELSGGQKQRVAIARELVKDPEVIFADEPTSALDKRSAKATIGILRVLAKERSVVVVTHDRSLLAGSPYVYELDKGTLSQAPKPRRAAERAARERRPPRLPIAAALRMGAIAVRRNLGHTLSILLAALISASLLLSSAGTAVAGAGQSEFDRLYASYGDQLLDLSLFSSFIGAGYNNGKKSDDPNVDVDQDLSGLYEKYAQDDRVKMLMVPQPFQDIHVTVDGHEYPITSTNNVPVMNKLLAGSMPADSKGGDASDSQQIAVPESFVKKLGISNEDAIGRELDFKGSVYNWASGSPVEVPLSAHVKISGVINTDMVSDVGGSTSKYSVDDSFFFSPATLKRMREAAGMSGDAPALYLRAKSPKDLISLKNELNANGIVPTGHFEQVEKLVKMNDETSQQTGSATTVMGTLSVAVVAAVALIGAILRRREFAILNVAGYVGRRLAGALVGEFVLLAVMSAALFVVASPVVNAITQALWRVSIMRIDLIAVGALMAAGLSLLAYVITMVVASLSRPADALQRGER
ncbi:ABC transporter related protein [Coriobacterium glomerans PW2]|uniref:ABC transporter related protein n=1 Tax=Coriobacterium glomerans (strain ATCC 49209 / DSM 20642 / JCM 10262 / PW2) TaxID=700015 RepID=F2N909_CORGP|nr:ABC transporter ATP-binding protein [Coriobacterium glomerans]AEB07609.1 ABC transporter related protein [Coriobacterium glomerans PW2]